MSRRLASTIIFAMALVADFLAAKYLSKAQASGWDDIVLISGIVWVITLIKSDY